jgi:hypothetical protein
LTVCNICSVKGGGPDFTPTLVCYINSIKSSRIIKAVSSATALVFYFKTAKSRCPNFTTALIGCIHGIKRPRCHPKDTSPSLVTHIRSI